jgi:CheY-like chemotaxis protein
LLRDSNNSSPLILLVEDDPGDQELIRRGFSASKVCVEIRVVESGDQALSYLRRREPFFDPKSFPTPDLILLDLNMPGCDGREVLREVRGEPELRHLPVVVLTTSSNRDDVRECYELGANSYITKPASFEGFTEVLQSLESYWLHTVELPDRGEADG